MKRMRGKGVKPAMVHVSLRLPVEVLRYFNATYATPSKGIRKVLIHYVTDQLKELVDLEDSKEVKFEDGTDSREESKG